MSALAIPVADIDRSALLGGSDIAAVLGLSPWKTPVQLWLEKTGQAVDAPTPEKQKLFARGKRWEPIALEMLVDELELRGHQVKVLARNLRYRDPDVPFFGCEVDVELLVDGEEVNGELKTVHAFAAKHWGEMDTDEIPIYYATQAQWGLGIRKRGRCVVGCLVGADNMTPYWVERDDESLPLIRAKAHQFWRHVTDRTPPDPQNFEDLRYLFRRDNGQPIEATAEIVEKAQQLAAVRASLKSFKDEEERLKFEIEAFMAPHARLTVNGRDIATLKSQEQERFAEKAFAAAHPELAAQFRRTIDFRVLRLK